MLAAFDGGVTLHLCGAPRRLKFNWSELGQLRAEYGPDFQTPINAAVSELDFEIMARVLSLATGGEVPVDNIILDSPPIVAAIRAIQAAFNAAYHGPDGPPKVQRRPLEWARTKLRAILSRIASKLG